MLVKIGRKVRGNNEFLFLIKIGEFEEKNEVYNNVLKKCNTLLYSRGNYEYS